MTFFGRPLGQIFNRSVASNAAFGLATGVAEYYLTHHHDEHRLRHAAIQGAEWGAVDALTEVGLNAFFPGARGKSAMQSALVEGGIALGTGAITGYAVARSTGDEHPFRRAAITASEWAVMDAGLEYGINSLFPGLRGNR